MVVSDPPNFAEARLFVKQLIFGNYVKQGATDWLHSAIWFLTTFAVVTNYQLIDKGDLWLVITPYIQPRQVISDAAEDWVGYYFSEADIRDNQPFLNQLIDLFAPELIKINF